MIKKILFVVINSPAHSYNIELGSFPSRAPLALNFLYCTITTELGDDYVVTLTLNYVDFYLDDVICSNVDNINLK